MRFMDSSLLDYVRRKLQELDSIPRFAKEMEIPVRTLYNILDPKHDPRVNKVERLARIFKEREAA
jgi:predicted transcriptional regulator